MVLAFSLTFEALFKLIGQHEDQSAFYGKSLSHFKWRKEGKSVRGTAQTMGIANAAIGNVIKKETTGVLSNGHKTA